MGHLFFKNSFTSSQKIKFCHDKGVRVDRVLEAEVL